MKTPMQELIEQLNNVKPQDFCSIETIKGWAKELLEKEKEVIMDAYMAGESDATHKIDSALNHYNETFNSDTNSDTAPSEATSQSAKNAQTTNPSLSR